MRINQRYSLLAALAGALLTAAAVPAQAEKQNTERDPWAQIQKLINEQKLEQAYKLAAERLQAAQSAKNDEEWTRALIQMVQLRTSLHGVETAVKLLRETPWPSDPIQRVALELFYAYQLDFYYQSYSWEIQQRQRIDSKADLDLKSWTKEQIFEEAERAFDKIWARREGLGSVATRSLSRYIVPADHPAGIRDTLRDSVSYLRARLLADTSTWTAEQQNDLYRLDLPALVAGNPAVSAFVKLDDPSVHPLVRVGAVLDDLEAWHLREGRREAALEARLERGRLLHAALPNPANHSLIVEDLRQRLAAFADVPWWSMGMATLAELLEQQDFPGNLVQAREVAQRGYEKFPSSPGGERCRHHAMAIEAPSLQLRGMSSDGPGRRSLEITHKNFPALFLRAYRFDLQRSVESERDEPLPSGPEMYELFKTAPAAQWKVELPPTPDFREHRTFITPPLTGPAAYVILASAREDFAPLSNHITGTTLILSDLVLLSRQEAGGLEVTAVSGDSGRALPGTTITFYRHAWGQQPQPIQSLVTNQLGTVRLEGQRGDWMFALARRGADLNIGELRGSHYPDERPQEETAALVFTDRSVYRPNQKAQWKVVAYRGRGDRASFKTLPRTQLKVTLFDANRQKLEERTVTTNDFGSAAGEFLLPPGKLLGQWHIAASPRGSAAIRVEEYKRPTFEVSIKDPDSALRLNREARFTGSARYYFGLPVTGGKATWKVVRVPLEPRGWGYRGRHREAERQTIASGSTSLEPDGTFAMAFTPRADERSAAVQESTYRFELTADVVDDGGETRSAQRFFRLGFVAVEASVSCEESFFLQGEAGHLSVTRTDLDATPRAGKGSWRLLALKQPERALLPAELPAPAPSSPAVYQTPGDKLRPRFEAQLQEDPLSQFEDGPELARGELQHGDKGEAAIELPPLSAGAYRLRYSTTDEFGGVYQTKRELIVAGPRTPLALPVLLKVQTRSVRAGGKARLLVHSGLSDQPMTLTTFQAGKRLDRRQLLSGQSPSLLEIPIGANERGGLTFQLEGVRDFQFLRQQESLEVPWDDKQLEVSFSSFRDTLRPGAKETWRVTAKGPKGAALDAGAAELLAYMYDLSLDLFAPHQPPDPLALFPNRAYGSWAESNLGSHFARYLAGVGFGQLPGYEDFTPEQMVGFVGLGLGQGETRALRQMRRDSIQDIRGSPAAPPRAQHFSEPSAAVSEQPPAAPPPTAVRSDFSETAFFKPQLRLEKDGSAAIEFTVPDSVTRWKVLVHALTRELASGSIVREARSLKELMVRPYLPRFLREGDAAELKVAVNNASDRELAGEVSLEIFDPETNRSLTSEFGLTGTEAAPRPFKVGPGAGTTVSFPLSAPRRLGTAAFKLVGTAGKVSDGELRPLPLLPSRVHLAQSRFATLKDKDRRELSFADLKSSNDPTLLNESLIVTLDAQLFHSVIAAVPYLINYPYECTEQTMNRFVSTGIIAAVSQRYPAVARAAMELSRRQTPLETFDGTDPNRKLALEESPWVVESQGGSGGGLEVANVLDLRVAHAEREASLAKLRKAQLPSGAFPWWPGGPPSEQMTAYLLYGFAKAAEFGIPVPPDMVQRAWGYLAQRVRENYLPRIPRDEVSPELLTFLNYAASAYPDPSLMGAALTETERRQLLDFSFRHWKQHSPYLKGLLALTLKRMGRPDDAKLVFDSVMDSAKLDKDLGLSWEPEDRAWLWYNDSTETHAHALRVLTELAPRDPRREGLVQWLLLDKKLGHWKSTRATAEVIYALVHYLAAEGQLGVREEARVAVGPLARNFAFEPDRYTGKKAQLVVPGAQVDPKAMSSVVVEKSTPGMLFASATWHFSTERPPAEDRGGLLQVSRTYFRRMASEKGAQLQPLAEGAALAPGDEVEVHLSLRAKHEIDYVHLRDPRAAGLEPISTTSGFKWNLGLGYYEEIRDSASNFFFEQLPAGEYTFSYRLRVAMAGTFKLGPATVQSMYAPELTAYSTGATLKSAGESPPGVP